MEDIRANLDSLVKIAVQGQISHPQVGSPYRIGHDGRVKVLPGTGGITYNVQIGDRVMGWAGDHVEPGVSVKVEGSNRDKRLTNSGLNLLACLGNTARVISGDAEGAEGVVTGKHGGIEHVICYFPPDDLEKMTIGDKIHIKACGQGLELAACPDVMAMNLGPELLEAIPFEIEDQELKVPVAATIPPELMGSGLGASTASRGDYDLTTADRGVLAELGLEDLRFGDLVALRDTDNSYGRCFRRGAVSIGVIVHSDCILAGHGPGVTTILTSREGKILPHQEEKANMAHYLKLRNI